MSELPLAPLERICKSVGDVRVSQDAVKILAEQLEEQAFIVADNAHKMAVHAGRKTIKPSDIKLAINTLYE